MGRRGYEVSSCHGHSLPCTFVLAVTYANELKKIPTGNVAMADPCTWAGVNVYSVSSTAIASRKRISTSINPVENIASFPAHPPRLELCGDPGSNRL
jgi:hypothetical protein